MLFSLEKLHHFLKMRLGRNTLFKLGKIVATHEALKAIKESNVSKWDLLNRHATGDWGCIPNERKRENTLCLDSGFSIRSVYLLDKYGNRLEVITNGDRSLTLLKMLDD